MTRRRGEGLHEPLGVLVVDKPGGVSSATALERIKRTLGIRRAGHAGTLDPMATGVLVICLGEATKLATYLLVDEKQYVATARLGVATDTYDADGQVVQTTAVPPLPEEAIARALESFLGRSRQVPPAFSALKKDGEPLYARARRGERVEPEAREIEVHSIELVRWAPPDLTFRVVCGKGTYVRTLAVDLASRLGTVGHLVALRRERSGCFSIEEAVSWAEIERGDRVALLARMAPPAAALRGLEVQVLADAEVAAIRQGKPIPSGCAGTTSLVDGSGELIAIGQCRERSVWPIRVFVGAKPAP